MTRFDDITPAITDGRLAKIILNTQYMKESEREIEHHKKRPDLGQRARAFLPFKTPAIPRAFVRVKRIRACGDSN